MRCTHLRPLDELEGGGDVVEVSEDRRRVDVLLAVLCHHARDRRLREKVLELVVGIVDEELLEAVGGEGQRRSWKVMEG